MTGADRRRSAGAGRPVIALAVTRGRYIQCGSRDCAARCVQHHRIVVTGIPVIDHVSRDLQRAPIGTHHVLRHEGLRQTGYCVRAIQRTRAIGRRRRRTGRSIVGLAVCRGVNVQTGSRDRAGGCVRRHRVVGARVPVVDRVSRDLQRASACAHHVLRLESLRQTGHRVGIIQRTRAIGRRRAGTGRPIIALTVTRGVNV